jgi:hypothetical protein
MNTPIPLPPVRPTSSAATPGTVWWARSAERLAWEYPSFSWPGSLYFANTQAALQLSTGRSLPVTFVAAGSVHFACQAWPQEKSNCTSLCPATGPSSRRTLAVRTWLASADPPLNRASASSLAPADGLTSPTASAPCAITASIIPAYSTKVSNVQVQ